ncbi:Hypothetical predicted protein [Olea europaea subsp. europaea]|uniref:DUF7138 domain-containing protein n=1 Tax=Olea europaea subsp. europaea TaxID=158383 RepID=A0A8S0QXX3_OLEEU|nr:Hypothetical predicted protein [Olea europaea subsp. europaea]
MSMDGWERLEARLVFFNGVKEINFENVAISPMMDYTELASSVSRIISFPPNELSIYLVKNLDSREPEGPEITLVGPESIKSALRCSKEDILLVVLNESKLLRSAFDWDGFNESLVNSQRKEPEPRLFSEVLKANPPQKLRLPTKDNQAITARPILNMDSNENKNADHPSVNEPVTSGLKTTGGPTARPIDDPAKLRVPTKDNQAITARPILNMDSNENKNADHPFVNEPVTSGLKMTGGPTARPIDDSARRVPTKDNQAITARPILNMDSKENKNTDQPFVNEPVTSGLKTTGGPTALPIDDLAVSAWIKFRKSAKK